MTANDSQSEPRPTRLLLALSSPTDVESDLAWGANIARALNVPLTLLHLLDPGTSREPTDRAAAISNDMLMIAASDNRFAGLDVATDVRVGLPQEELRKATEEHVGSLPMLRAGAPGVVRRTLLGNDAHAVIRSLTSPFVILPAQSIAPIRIERAIVGFDGSDLAEEVQRVSSNLAGDLGVALTIVQVIESSKEPEHEFLALTPTLEERRVMVRGRAGETLLAVARARRAGVIIVGSHGRGQMTRLLLGSTSEWLADHADRPVLIVPQRGGPSR